MDVGTVPACWGRRVLRTPLASQDATAHVSRRYLHRDLESACKFVASADMDFVLRAQIGVEVECC